MGYSCEAGAVCLSGEGPNDGVSTFNNAGASVGSEREGARSQERGEKEGESETARVPREIERLREKERE